MYPFDDLSPQSLKIRTFYLTMISSFDFRFRRMLSRGMRLPKMERNRAIFYIGNRPLFMLVWFLSSSMIERFYIFIFGAMLFKTLLSCTLHLL